MALFNEVLLQFRWFGSLGETAVWIAFCMFAGTMLVVFTALSICFTTYEPNSSHCPERNLNASSSRQPA